MRTITVYKEKRSATPSDTKMADEFNHFYSRFDLGSAPVLSLRTTCSSLTAVTNYTLLSGSATYVNAEHCYVQPRAV